MYWFYRQKSLLAFCAVLATVAALPLLLRKAEESLASNMPYVEDSNTTVLPEPTKAPSFVCSDMLEITENDVTLALSSDTKVVECMTVGCSGLF